MTVADLQVQAVINIIERDIVFDEALTSLQQHMNASLDSETVERETSSLGHDGKIRARYDREVRLIVPLPQKAPTFAPPTV
jgi:hypothetical protein